MLQSLAIIWVFFTSNEGYFAVESTHVDENSAAAALVIDR